MLNEAIPRIRELEQKLHLPENFYLNLAQEDDWSFVIKTNALFEAVSTHLLTVRLGAQELEDAFSYLDFGNAKFGKVVMLRKLGCLTKEHSIFLQKLYELRNKLAHNISHVNFKFENHVSLLDSNQKKSFVEAIRAGASETIYWNCEDQPREKFILKHAKFSIWLTGAEILLRIHEQASPIQNI